MIYISSQERMSDLFSCYELNGAVHMNGIMKYTFCGKVEVVDSLLGRHVFGYILSEVDEGWEILLENNERI